MSKEDKMAKGYVYRNGARLYSYINNSFVDLTRNEITAYKKYCEVLHD